MATHSSILAWKIPVDRGAWWAKVHGVTRARHNLATKQHQLLVGLLLGWSKSSSGFFCNIL